MQIIDVKTIYPGIVSGSAYLTDAGPKADFENCQASQKDRYFDAKNLVKEDLRNLLDNAENEAVGEILNSYIAILEDEEFDSTVVSIINNEHASASQAVEKGTGYFISLLEKSDDELIKSRVNDISDISGKIIDKLNGPENKEDVGSNMIIVSEYLSVTDILKHGRRGIAALVSFKDTANSHAAIVAASLKIPTVVINNPDCKKELFAGKTLLVDGYEGRIYIEPDEETIQKTGTKSYENNSSDSATACSPDSTALPLKVYANINSVFEIDEAMKNGADGIGLFRTEFIFLQKNDFPAEEEQFEIYKEAAVKASGKEFVIRTIDIGADKNCDYFNLKDEENPALGLRGIRLCLAREDVFKTQLRAVLRASAFGSISVMFPMLSSVDEAKETCRILKEVKDELTDKGIAFNENIKKGAMIETPAAALCADELAEYFDFFSVGSNDLTQYTLAVDRTNAECAAYYDAKHPAVLSLIKKTIDAARKHNIKVTICGELAADISFTKDLSDMGFDGLSVAAPKLQAVINACSQ